MNPSTATSNTPEHAESHKAVDALPMQPGSIAEVALRASSVDGTVADAQSDPDVRYKVGDVDYPQNEAIEAARRGVDQAYADQPPASTS